MQLNGGYQDFTCRESAVSWGVLTDLRRRDLKTAPKLAIGDGDQALKLYQDLLATGKQIIQRFGESAQRLRDVAVCYPVGSIEHTEFLHKV